MRFLLAAVVGCYLCLAVQGQNIMERAGHLYEARPRLGHFAPRPFTDLYVNYVAAFVLPQHPERPNDDYRNYQPSGDECVTFFTHYVSHGYNLDDIEKVVLLDACLGYLYGAKEAHVEEDKEKSAYLKSNFDALKANQKLRDLYEGTKINEFSEPAQLCLGNLLLDSIRAKHQFSDVACNDDWLNLFNTFAACHTTIPEAARTTDTYVSLIYDLVKVRGNICFHEEVHILNASVRRKFASSYIDRFSNKAAATYSSMAAQEDERMWPADIVRLLTAVQNPQKLKEKGIKGKLGITKYQQLNLRKITNLLKYAAMDEPGHLQTLTKNLAYAATKAIKPWNNQKGDPKGIARYTEWVDRLCNFFRASDNRSSFDYTTPIERMIKMTEYPEIYGITEADFTEAVLTHGYETASLYLSLYSCNLMTFTTGILPTEAQNNKPSYLVSFLPNKEAMVVWPMPEFD